MQEFWRDVFNFLTYIIPRPYEVSPDELGVWCRFGAYKGDIAPGSWQWYWPPTEVCYKVQACEQIKPLADQYMTTSDDTTLSVRGAISYEILPDRQHDAIFEVYDLEESLTTLAESAFNKVISTRPYADCKDPDSIAKEVTELIRKVATTRWGVKVLSVAVNCKARNKVYTILGSQAPIPLDYEEEEE